MSKDVELGNDDNDESEKRPPATESDAVAEGPIDSSHLADLPSYTSDTELSFHEALMLTRRRGACLILLMGEVGTGKTTIMVELWTHLVGIRPISDYRCGGSRTAMAFEERAFLSRMAAGVTEAETPRTHIDENEGLLHMRVVRPDAQRKELLFADYSGERFRHVREGTPLLEELPWVSRADRVAVVIDGSSFSTGGSREVAINDATRQVYALRESDSFHQSSRLSIVVAKNDQVSDADFEAAQPRLDALLREAQTLDDEAQLLRVAARPSDGSSAVGLDAFLDFVCSPDRETLSAPVSFPSPVRAVARFHGTQ